MAHQIDVRSGGEPASCGDFAEHLYLDPFRSALIVGDIAGRGPAVGGAADALRAYTRSALLSGAPLPNCLGSIDSFFARSIMTETVPFASLFIAISDQREAKLLYASAGHEPGLLFDTTGRHRHLDPTGPILGLQAMLTQSVFTERAVPIAGSDLLVVVTDGITEARRSDGAELSFFGSTGVARAVRDARLSLRDTASAVHDAAVEHARGALSDDASVALFAFAVQQHTNSATPRRTAVVGWDALTKAEQRVAFLIANGHSNRSVASELIVSQSTVATHARSIFGKLGVASRVQLTRSVMERNWQSRGIEVAS
jgi:DNA-binding CsgD family transcriptional regulator